MTATTTPLGGKSMGDRCLSALASLGGEATTEQVRAQAQADWNRPLTAAQVAVTLARLARAYCPKVTRHPAPEGGWSWRTAEAEGFRRLTAADAEAPAAELPAFGAAVAVAARDTPCLAPGSTAGSPRTAVCAQASAWPCSAARNWRTARTLPCSGTGHGPAPASAPLTTRCTAGREGLHWPCSGRGDRRGEHDRPLGCRGRDGNGPCPC